MYPVYGMCKKLPERCTIKLLSGNTAAMPTVFGEMFLLFVYFIVIDRNDSVVSVIVDIIIVCDK